MRLATLRTSGGTQAARVVGDRAELLHWRDVGEVLQAASSSGDRWTDLVERASSEGEVDLALADLAPVIPRPAKIVCVGLNYAKHITEMGRDLPEYPTLFAKYPEALIGPTDEIQLAPESDAVDWEAELVVVIGSPVRRATPDQSESAIAGFTIMNDVTMRDWQDRSPMWLQGKTFEGTTPLGPVLVSPDELVGGVRPALTISTNLDGELMQEAVTDDLVFDPPSLVAYVSTIMTLLPGDVIATGTPGGVGHARKPPRYITAGQTLTTTVEGIGQLVNPAGTEQV